MEMQKLAEAVKEHTNDINHLNQKFVFLEKASEMSIDQYDLLKERMQGMDKKMDAQFVDLNKKVDWQFAEVDKKFDKVDQRFEQVDKRFDDLPDIIRGKILYPIFIMFAGTLVVQVISGPIVKKLFGL